MAEGSTHGQSGYNDLANDPLNRIQQTLDQTADQVNENVNMLLSRGNDLDRMQGDSELMMRDTEDMYRHSAELKRRFRNRNIRLWVSIASVVLLVVFIAVWTYCGLRFQRCRRR